MLRVDLEQELLDRLDYDRVESAASTKELIDKLEKARNESVRQIEIERLTSMRKLKRERLIGDASVIVAAILVASAIIHAGSS